MYAFYTWHGGAWFKERGNELASSVTLEVEDDDALIAIDFLVDNIDLSKSRLKKLMGAGGVWLFRAEQPPVRLRRAMSDLRPGDRIGVNYDPDRLDQVVRKATLIEDHTLYSLWSKPAGMVMRGDWWGDHNSVERQVALAFNKERPVWIITPLPGAGRGVVLVAHHQRAVLNLETMPGTPDWLTRVRFRVTGNWEQAPDRLASTLADAADAVGFVLDELVVEKYQPRDNTSQLYLVSTLSDTRQLIEWGAQLGMTFVGAGENLPADDLALALDRDEHDRGTDHGADRFDLLQVDSLSVSFTCPFTGERRNAEAPAGNRR